ncbi:hypothetical protein Ddc_15623 [Ditylenchus destructor]|nr:hypothetical protein Ddc_15623 [Ditylenchus destructor]
MRQRIEKTSVWEGNASDKNKGINEKRTGVETRVGLPEWTRTPITRQESIRATVCTLFISHNDSLLRLASDHLSFTLKFWINHWIGSLWMYSQIPAESVARVTNGCVRDPE